MPRHGKWPVRQRSRDRALVTGSFETANGAAPTITGGEGFTVTREAEGRWTVALLEPCVKIETVLVSQARETLPTDGGAELVEVVVDQDSIDTDSFEVKAYLKDASDGAAAPALDDQPGMRVSFIAVVKETSY
jgi:hypothetical protein